MERKGWESVEDDSDADSGSGSGSSIDRSRAWRHQRRRPLLRLQIFRRGSLSWVFSFLGLLQSPAPPSLCCYRSIARLWERGWRYVKQSIRRQAGDGDGDDGDGGNGSLCR